MGLICIAARSAARSGNRPRQTTRKWPWQVRLIWLAAIVGTLAMIPAGRVILAVIGGLLAACVIGVLCFGFSAAGSRGERRDPVEEFLDQQEDAKS